MQNGFAVAENLDAEQQSLRQAHRNTNDGISVIQTAEGATNEVGDMLKRMRELAVQSSSETLNNSERAYIQDEFTQLTAEVDRIAQVTEFNGIELGNGSNAQVNYRWVSTTATTGLPSPWETFGQHLSA